MNIFSCTIAAAYIVVRFCFTRQLDTIGPYGSYIFELACVAIAIAVSYRNFLTTLKVNKFSLFGVVAGLVAGFCIFKLALITGIPIPFDLSGTETIVLLLIVAPILEEALFRFFLWQPILFLTKRPPVVWILTSALFSYSHLHAIWFVPNEIHNFIIYQTAYTLLLGLACGYFVYRYSSLTGAILVHFSFNFGFYLASLL